MLFVGDIDGHFDPVELRWREGASCRGCSSKSSQTADVGAMQSSTMVRVREERNKKKSYASLDPKAKSDSERCIRVAAMVIMTSEGDWNI